MFIVIDTDTQSDTNDIICYMIVFWELNSYWDNFKILLQAKWNEKNLDSLSCVKLFGQFAV